MEFKKFGGYRLGSNIPVNKGAVWENVARVARWGAPVIELNTNAERLGTSALKAIKEIAQANDIVYTWHVPPNADESGEFAVPNDPRTNEFARRVMERAINAAAEVGAKHITFHPTHQARRLPEDQLYVYDARTNQVSTQKVIEDLNKEEMIKLLNDSAKAELRTKVNNFKSQRDMVNNMDKTIKLMEREGVNDANAMMLAGIVGTVSRFSQMVGLQPENYSAWQRIQNKLLNNQAITGDEKQIIKNYTERVSGQLGDYKELFSAQEAQLKPMLKKPNLVEDGEAFMRQNVANNIAQLRKEDLQKAVSNGISLGFENLPAQILFSTPQELNDLRDRTVKALVNSGKVTKAQAENLVGFTFDFGHANTTKYIELAGKEFASPSEFIEQLKGPVKHVHATDSAGIVDSHLPLGMGEVTKDEFEKIKKALARSGFKGTAVHELAGSGVPALYGLTMEFVEDSNYFVGGQPTASFWGPSYISEGVMTDPLMLEKDRGYFYETFADIY